VIWLIDLKVVLEPKEMHLEVSKGLFGGQIWELFEARRGCILRFWRGDLKGRFRVWSGGFEY
jgi:hypothetical protein